MFLNLAWRNVWRNPRRTAVILIAVVIGVWSMIFLGSLMRGMINEIIASGISTLTGHIQIQHKGYYNDPVVENSILNPKEAEQTVDSLCPAGTLWTPRILVGGVASNARHNSGIRVVGMDPAREAKVSFIGQAVKEGEYLKAGDKYGILIGKALADKFGTRIGQKIILMSQDTTKEIASRAFTIRGIYRAQMQETEKTYVFITLPAAQNMLKLGKGVSEIAITLPEISQVDQVKKLLKARLPKAQYAVMDWEELQPILKAYLSMTMYFTYIWNVVVFIAMGFGIVNTTLMAVYERMREFGILKALGMRPWWIIKEVLAESFFLLVFGIVLGNALGFASAFLLDRAGGINLSALAAGSEYWGMPQILMPALEAQDVLFANCVVFFLGILVCLYPAVKAARFTPVEAMVMN